MSKNNNKWLPFLCHIALLGIKAYQWLISPLLPKSCRFLPSCSDYALDAFKEHPFFKALWLTVKRLARCHPWGGSGYDPVPKTRKRE
jgi:putative membrane protein insertion efficiency factor